jgi:homoserine kinase
MILKNLWFFRQTWQNWKNLFSMAEKDSVIVQVPATTANLGPGFDCLGLALNLWNEVAVSLEGDGLSIEIRGEGEKILAKDSSNLIYQSFALAVSRFGIEPPKGISIICFNQIPVASGLGSSSSAIVAGLLAAQSLFSLNLSIPELLEIGLELEEHADNMTACLLGGLVVVVQDGRAVITQKIKINHFKATIALPLVQLSTRQARRLLPEYYSREDVVFNISRTASLVSSLVSGDLTHLRNAMQDRIHQPYRLGLIPGAQAALEAAYANGAIGAALSGAGPSLIAFHSAADDRIANAMQKSFEQENMAIRLFATSTINTGAFIK